MGLADIVPGVSGGTIALISGIYERLIFAIRSIDLKFIPLLIASPLKRKYLEEAKENFSSIDLKFLLSLGAGIVLAFLAASQVIRPALDRYPAYIYSFFFGLILISAQNVYQRIESINIKSFSFGAIGFLFAAFFVGLEGFSTNHSLPIIFLAGFLAICAMILPGISGSFIVLFLGQYEYMLEVLRSLHNHIPEVIVFLSGAVLSLLSFSRVISHFLREHYSKTLFFLTGIMIGALRLPLEKIIEVPAIPENTVVLSGAIISGMVGGILIYSLSRKYPLPEGKGNIRWETS